MLVPQLLLLLWIHNSLCSILTSPAAFKPSLKTVYCQALNLGVALEMFKLSVLLLSLLASGVPYRLMVSPRHGERPMLCRFRALSDVAPRISNLGDRHAPLTFIPKYL